jgi:hypothetical protein
VTKYGKAAVRATQLILSGDALSPPTAWAKAVREVFQGSASSQEKGCPRSAYLGLCESGLIRDVEPGSYTRSILNKRYAVRAVALLRAQPALAADPVGLWRRVVGGETKQPNNQIDVVIALWRAGLLES